jgi:hypothetical protein
MPLSNRGGTRFDWEYNTPELQLIRQGGTAAHIPLRI